MHGTRMRHMESVRNAPNRREARGASGKYMEQAWYPMKNPQQGKREHA